ncbi:MAG: TonB-dependent receptor [bacterium]
MKKTQDRNMYIKLMTREKSMRFVVTLIIMQLVISAIVFAQSGGSIAGKISDLETGEFLIGANVQIVNTKLGAAADLDGYYNIKNIQPGTYTLKFSFISYQPLSVENVVVKAGEITKLDVNLSSTSQQLAEVIVSADALKSYEGTVLQIQKQALNIVDGLSAELISKNNSSDGTDILKRMTGVTISEGKYAFVRGVGDRYNNTLLNGASLPSTDPEKKSFSYDLFPASLIENVFTSKTFTPDKPADFSGGLVEINTVEFPEKFILNVDASSSYNAESSLKDVLSSNGGSKDWLGVDDGTREQPSLIRDEKVGRGSYTAEELQSIGQQFKNNWSTKSARSPLNGSMKINLGDRYAVGDNSILGYIASLTYSNSFNREEIQKNNYTFEGPRYLYDGVNYTNSVSWGALFNVSLKLGQSNKFSFKNVYNVNSDNEITNYKGEYLYNPDYRDITSIRFVSRSLISNQFIGEHFVDLLSGLKIDWNLNYSASERNEPDAMRYIYLRDYYETTDPLRFQLDQSLATRFFSGLDDNSFGGSANFSINLFDDPNLPKLKLGTLYNKKERTFDARIFGFKNIPGGNYSAEDSLLQGSVDGIFQSENFNSKFIEVVEITKPSDSYSSNQTVTAGYIMTDFMVFDRLKIITGVRYELSNQKLTSQSITGEPIEVDDNYDDILPSINLTYALTNEFNIRAAYTKTLARPEFRELAPFTYFDFLANELVQGNTELKRSLIDNVDLRFEFYPAPKELMAVSFFYKQFKDPIEQVLIASSGFEPIRSYENAMKAKSYGLEIELRKELGFIAGFMNNFSFVGNMSFIKSEIELDVTEFQTSKRPLQGQADFISNLGIYYDDYINTFSASLIYNKVGERIDKVGFVNVSDIIELPRDQVDFSVSKGFFNMFTLKFAVRDVLAQDYKFVQRSEKYGEQISELRKKSPTYSLGLSYKF